MPCILRLSVPRPLLPPRHTWTSRQGEHLGHDPRPFPSERGWRYSAEVQALRATSSWQVDPTSLGKTAQLFRLGACFTTLTAGRNVSPTEKSRRQKRVVARPIRHIHVSLMSEGSLAQGAAQTEHVSTHNATARKMGRKSPYKRTCDVDSRIRKDTIQQARSMRARHHGVSAKDVPTCAVVVNTLTARVASSVQALCLRVRRWETQSDTRYELSCWRLPGWEFLLALSDCSQIAPISTWTLRRTIRTPWSPTTCAYSL